MKKKILNLILILTSFLGYLEWGNSKSMFLFQGELDVFSQFLKDPLSLLHPFVLLPLIGQILLLITLFQKEPGKILTFTGMAGVGILLLLILLVGLLNQNPKMIVSSFPFLLTSAYISVLHLKKKADF